MYQDKLDLRSLAAKEWRFMRGDHSVIADRIKLRDDGAIEGHYHSNEVGWAIVEDAVVFLDVDGQVSTAFKRMTQHLEDGAAIEVTLEGSFRQTAGRHFLRERNPEETSDHNPVAVDQAVALINSLPLSLMRDVAYIEHQLIPALGLNNEMLHEQPRELSSSFGKGLFLWQYPNQFAKYLAWLTDHAADIERFAEIGCRWGGTFIVVCEWLKRVSPRLHAALAIDPIVPSVFLERYLALTRGSTLNVTYLQDFSTSDRCRETVSKMRPDMVFIDGDHDVRTALADHLLARDFAKIIVHHDIASDACPDAVLVWRAVCAMEGGFSTDAFVDQYESVEGSYLGIGCLRRLTLEIESGAPV